MTKIGVLSDTHGFLDPKIVNFFIDCDEIWHAGDIGNLEIVNSLQFSKVFRAVYGNIDPPTVRNIYPKMLRFTCENVDIMITHIGGYPGNYDKSIYSIIKSHPPQLFISGHSHILKIQYDNKNQLLHINPGAAGNVGLHKVKTAVRFNIDKEDIQNMEILEIPRK